MTDAPKLLSREDIELICDLITRALENLPTRTLYESYGETGWDADDNALVDDALRGALKAIAALEAERDAAYRRGLEDAAKMAERHAAQNAETAATMHKRAAKQARLYNEDVADQTKISAQVLDACAEEATCLAAAIRALKPGDNELKQGEADAPTKAE